MEESMKVYEYGLRHPTKNQDEVLRQIRQSARYYNQLVEIERARRGAIRDLERASCPDLAAVEGAIAEHEGLIETARRTHRAVKAETRKAVDTGARDTALAALYAAIKTLRSRAGELRKSVRGTAEYRDRVAEIDAAAGTKVRDARARCEVYWGTYLLIEAAVDAAKKAPAKPRGPRPATPWHLLPHFKRFDGEGSIGVQLQGGLAVADVLGEGDTRFQIIPQPDAPAPTSNRQRLRPRMIARVRIGSIGRAPVWAEFPFLMHRPLPDGGTIKWARVALDQREGRRRWFLQITVDAPDPVPDAGRRGVVAVDLGWRKVDGGIRAAYWVDDGGRQGSLVLPDSIEARMSKAEAIRSSRDALLDEVKADLLAALGASGVVGTGGASGTVGGSGAGGDGATSTGGVLSRLSPANRERVRTMHAWRSPGRFVAMLRAMESDRVSGDEDIVARLDAYWRRDLHLWRYERGLAREAMGHRRDVYRVFAAKLATEYGAIAVEKWDMRDTAERDEDGDETYAGARRRRVVVAPYELRQCIEHAASSRGTEIVRVDAAYTTIRSHASGAPTVDDPAESIELRYADGLVIDQDENAARRILASAVAVRESAGPLASTTAAKPKRKSRWSKRHAAEATSNDGDRSQT